VVRPLLHPRATLPCRGSTRGRSSGQNNLRSSGVGNDREPAARNGLVWFVLGVPRANARLPAKGWPPGTAPIPHFPGVGATSYRSPHARPTLHLPRARLASRQPRPRSGATSVGCSFHAQPWNVRLRTAIAAWLGSNAPCPWRGHSCHGNPRRSGVTLRRPLDARPPCCARLSLGFSPCWPTELGTRRNSLNSVQTVL
jgi:hypothetical protein